MGYMNILHDFCNRINMKGGKELYVNTTYLNFRNTGSGSVK